MSAAEAGVTTPVGPLQSERVPGRSGDGVSARASEIDMDGAGPALVHGLALVATSVAVGCASLPVIIIAEAVRMPLHEAVAASCATLAAGVGAGTRLYAFRHPNARYLALRQLLPLTVLIPGVAAVCVPLLGSAGATGVVFLALLACLAGWDAAGAVWTSGPEWEGGRAARVTDHGLFTRFAVGAIVIFTVSGAGQQLDRYHIGPRLALPAVQFAVSYVGYAAAGLAVIALARADRLTRRWKELGAVAETGVRRRAGVQILVAATVVVVAYGAAAGAVSTGVFSPLMSAVGRVVASPPNRYRLGPGINMRGWQQTSCGDFCNRREGGSYGGQRHKHKRSTLPRPPAAPIDGRGLALDLLFLALAAGGALFVLRRWLRRWLLLVSARLRLVLYRLMGRSPPLSPGGLYAGAGAMPTTGRRPPWKRFIPGALSPRERVLLDYRRLLQIAARRGLPRPIGQTPNEYEKSLAIPLAPAGTDLQSLTAAFLEARFSPSPIGDRRAADAHLSWLRVRTQLQSVQRKDKP